MEAFRVLGSCFDFSLTAFLVFAGDTFQLNENNKCTTKSSCKIETCRFEGLVFENEKLGKLRHRSLKSIQSTPKCS